MLPQLAIAEAKQRLWTSSRGARVVYSCPLENDLQTLLELESPTPRSWMQRKTLLAAKTVSPLYDTCLWSYLSISLTDGPDVDLGGRRSKEENGSEREIWRRFYIAHLGWEKPGSRVNLRLHNAATISLFFFSSSQFFFFPPAVYRSVSSTGAKGLGWWIIDVRWWTVIIKE